MSAPVPLVLVPGLLCDDRLWAHQSRFLSDLATPTIGNTLEDDSIAGMAGRILDAAPQRFALACRSVT